MLKEIVFQGQVVDLCKTEQHYQPLQEPLDETEKIS